MERILVGIDGSGPSLKAVDFAADLASKYNAELIVLTVAPQFPSEVDPAIEEYARLEHITSPATELVLTTADICLITLEKGLRRRVQRGFWLSAVSATPPRKSSLQPKTGRPI